MKEREKEKQHSQLLHLFVSIYVHFPHNSNLDN